MTPPTTPEGAVDAEQKIPEGPRTYQSAWQWDAEGRPLLMTAEDWLAEEAMVYATIAQGEDYDGPSREGTMRAIVAEIRTLRRDAALWSAQATKNARTMAFIEKMGVLHDTMVDPPAWRFGLLLVDGKLSENLAVYGPRDLQTATEEAMRHRPVALPSPPSPSRAEDERGR
jgi:hypothetical protein